MIARFLWLARLGQGRQPLLLGLFSLSLWLKLGFGLSAVSQPSPSPWLTDSRGQKVLLPHKPQRLASASVASDEILWLLLKEAGASQRLIAVSLLADNPAYSHIAAEVKGIPARVGGSLEALLTLKPELVIMAEFNRPELIQQMERAKVPSFLLAGFDSLAAIEKATRQIAHLIHEAEAGERVVARMRAELKRLALPPARLRPKVLAWHFDHSVYGLETIFDSMLAAAGGQNVLETWGIRGWPHMSDEALAGLAPDWLVMSAEEKERALILERLGKLPYCKRWPAVEKNQLLLMPSRYLSASSPFVVEGVSWLWQRLHLGTG